MILVVDDEDEVRNFTTETLAGEGYEVCAACNGSEALAMLAMDPAICVLLTDITMPGALDGWRLAREAKRLRPELSVVYTSGFVEHIPAEEARLGYGPLLRKPWRRTELFDSVRDALARV